MPTTFVLHPFGKESAPDNLPPAPTWGYTSWTYDLLVSRRSGSSPTLDVGIEVSPVPSNDDLYESVHAFTQVTGATVLPASESQAVMLPPDARYHRATQAVSGEWWYQLKAAVTLFNPLDAEHVALLSPRVQDYSNLKSLSEQAEDDVVRRYTQKRPGGQEYLGVLTDSGRLMIATDEDTGGSVREAIARRIEWMHRRLELEKSAKDGDLGELRRHKHHEWTEVDMALAFHAARVPLYGM